MITAWLSGFGVGVLVTCAWLVALSWWQSRREWLRAHQKLHEVVMGRNTDLDRGDDFKTGGTK